MTHTNQVSVVRRLLASGEPRPLSSMTDDELFLARAQAAQFSEVCETPRESRQIEQVEAAITLELSTRNGRTQDA